MTDHFTTTPVLKGVRIQSNFYQDQMIVHYVMNKVNNIYH